MERVHSTRAAAQSLVEWGFILALVAVVCVASLVLFGGKVGGLVADLAHTVSINLIGGG
jgi:Flp pilus assembly pilin Flp